MNNVIVIQPPSLVLFLAPQILKHVFYNIIISLDNSKRI